jgi:putative transposase
MKRNCAYKYEIRLNGGLRKQLAQHAGVARFAFNWGLGLRVSLYEKEKKSTNAIEQHKLLNSLKPKEFPWMYEVSKCAPQEALRDLDRAFHNFFRGLKSGVKIGYPALSRFLAIIPQVNSVHAVNGSTKTSFFQKEAGLVDLVP